jgi:zinc transporter ZupT
MVMANVIMAAIFGGFAAGLFTAIGIMYVVFRKEMKKRA